VLFVDEKSENYCSLEAYLKNTSLGNSATMGKFSTQLHFFYIHVIVTIHWCARDGNLAGYLFDIL